MIGDKTLKTFATKLVKTFYATADEFERVSQSAIARGDHVQGRDDIVMARMLRVIARIIANTAAIETLKES